ncbi:hypothetical protein cyc_03923 [Cyclospora cayetanensis]|uniref:Uncharacterized protein n=1 Tax=Cyclospora cayetanensis TaxID=88456 RepID=A0A1D3CVV1_9EIME|nr:hypothetical protein cyc_03923 [Cyclospora cayetanensis]
MYLPSLRPSSDFFCRCLHGSVSVQRGFYYRFHKRVGTGSFSRYREFFVRPRALEATQRMRFVYEAPFAAAKASSLKTLRWKKRIAAATDAQQLLHVIEAYRILCRDILKASRRFESQSSSILLEIPAVAAKAFMLLPGVKLRLHKFLLNAIAAAAMPYLSEMPAGDLLKLLQGYAGAQLHHYGLVSAVAAEIQRRVHAAAAAAAAVSSEIPGKGSSIGSEEGRSNAAQWKSDEVWIQEASGVAAAPKGQQRRQKAASGIVPSLEQLVDFHGESHRRKKGGKGGSQKSRKLQGRVSEAGKESCLLDMCAFATVEAFAALKYRDWSFLQLLSKQVQEAIRQAPPERPFAMFSPLLLGRSLEGMRHLKANDVELLLAVLEHIHRYLYDCCPQSVALTGRCTAVQLPPDLPSIREKHAALLEVLRDMGPTLRLEEVVCAAAFAAASSVSRPLKASVLASLAERVLTLQETPGGGLSDVALLAEILLRNGKLNTPVFDVLARLIHRHLEVLEPQDLSRLARFLKRAKEASLESETLLNATSRHVLRLSSVFAPPDLQETLSCLMEAGPPHRRYSVLLHQAVATDSEDLEDSLQRISSQQGKLLLGRAAARASRAKAAAAASTGAAGEGADGELTASASSALASCEESLARRRYSHRRRILEEEGWDLLHRRVGSMRDLKQWL